MTTEPYNYEPIAQHPKLVTFYNGWLGQKICHFTHSAVVSDRSDFWSSAATEVDRLVVVLNEAQKTKALKLSAGIKAALGELIGQYAAGGWWTSSDGTRERVACQQARREQDEFPDCEPGSSDLPFQPRLLLERNPVYSVGATVVGRLDAALMRAAAAMDALDVCRLGVLLAGFCYRSTPQLGIPFINSVFNDLAAHGMTDLGAENAFRRAVGLSEISEDRRPRSISDPVPVPALAPEDVTAGHGEQDPFAPHVGDLTDCRDLVLACVFRHFDVPVPPAESDALRYPELAGLKKKLQAASGKAAESVGKSSLSEQTEFWSEEALEYLGITRRNLARPDMALQRLIQKGALRPTKIGGRLVFKKDELDRVLEKGDQAPRRGRPRKDGK